MTVFLGVAMGVDVLVTLRALMLWRGGRGSAMPVVAGDMVLFYLAAARVLLLLGVDAGWLAVPLAAAGVTVLAWCGWSGGRVRVYVEPRDLWVGVYVAVDAVYVCPLPVVVCRVARGELAGRGVAGGRRPVGQMPGREAA